MLARPGTATPTKLRLRLHSALAVVLAVTACANPSVVRVKDAEIGKISITKVFVPRFEGNPNFVEESTDLFIAELESRISASVIQGSALRTELTDVLAGGNLAPTELAIAKAKEVGAQVLVMGKITSHNTAGMLNGFSTVRVIDVAKGSVLASFHRPSGKLIANSEHQTVMAAVSRTADDVAKALR
tara:strand:+ start:3870 stop:4427 length:558 start_codon:yes stop_codon:yes gene_type:complete